MKTKIILEMGCNHNGEIGNAKQMIDEAEQLGVWGVKFQKRDIDSIPEIDANKPRNKMNSFGSTYREHRAFLEFSLKDISELKKYTEEKGLAFVVSVFDEESASLMIDIDVRYIKLPSQLSSNVRLIKHIKDNSVDEQNLIISTGMHTFDEIKNMLLPAIDIALYCRSIYPCSINQIHYGGMERFFRIAKNNNINVGYSSHDKEGVGIPLAVALGAEYIERHYTLNKAMKGSDHGTVSSDFKEMQHIIYGVHAAEEYLNPFDIDTDLLPEEKKVRRQFRGF